MLGHYEREVTVTFEDENYLVRDNGSVLRNCRKGKNKRQLDEIWTFGTENSANPYLHLAGVRIHRIVATAFHGEPPDSKYVVDHIDTNCRNNRPENLRWLSRLENALKNPATRKKIEYLCGSIEAFLQNPSMLNDLQSDPNYKWMRAVTPEEARNCMTRMSLWASSEKKSAKSSEEINHKSSFEKRVYKPIQKWEAGLGREPGLDLALTPWCEQYMWRAPAYFPSCPSSLGANPVEDYFQNLKSGDVFSYTDYEELCPKFTVHETKILEQKSLVFVLCERADSKWSIVGITINEKKYFIHSILGTYANKDEAYKNFASKNEQTDLWSEAYSSQYD